MVMHQAQVSQRISDFLTVVEPQPAVNSIRNTLAHQGFFEHPGLGIGTIENGAFAAQIALADPGRDGIGNIIGFILLVERGVQADRLTFHPVSPEFLAQTPLVVGNHRVGGFQNGLGGAVVLLQPHQPGIGEIPLVLLDILDLRAPPAVDGLVVIAHHRQRHPVAGQHLQPGVLNGVGVLELVHQYVLEALLVVAQQFRPVQPELVGSQQQFTKIHQAALLAELLVLAVDLQHGIGEVIARILLNMIRPQTLIFLAVDKPLGLFRRPLAFVNLELPHHPLDQP